MAAVAVENYKGFRAILNRILNREKDQYPFYCLLLYTPENGLNARLHKYVKSHWDMLDGLTGPNCLLMAIESIGPKIPIEKLKPEDVYNIARYLGAPVDTIPGIIFFTEPSVSKETQILKLKEFFSDPNELSDEELTDFFVSVQAIIDRCCNPAMRLRTGIRKILRLKTADRNLECLRQGLNDKWPPNSRWADVAKSVPHLVVATITSTATIAIALDQIRSVLLHLL